MDLLISANKLRWWRRITFIWLSLIWTIDIDLTHLMCIYVDKNAAIFEKSFRKNFANIFFHQKTEKKNNKNTFNQYFIQLLITSQSNYQNWSIWFRWNYVSPYLSPYWTFQITFLTSITSLVKINAPKHLKIFFLPYKILFHKMTR